jgi:uncharacterized protein involved in outer membrane biogenesis
MKKLLMSFGIGLVVLLVVLFLARNFIARKSVEIGAEKMTGFPLTIGSVDVGMFSGKLDVHDVKLMNPPEFPEKMFVDMPQLSIDYRLSSMLSGAPHINDMLVDIKQLVITQNDKGESNAMKLKGVVSSGGGSTKYRVDKLRIHVGTVTMIDRSRKTRDIPLNVNATYNNITDSTDIMRLVLLTVATQVRLPDIKPEDLKKGLGGVTDAAGNILKGVSENAEKTGKGFLDTLKKAIPQQQQENQ